MGLFGHLFGKKEKTTQKPKPGKTPPSPPPPSKASAPVETAEGRPAYENFHLAGLAHYADAIDRLASENYTYDCTKRDLVDLYEDDDWTRIWEFEYPSKPVELVPEPENEFDKNAVKVILAGEHIGYIKKASCSRVKNLLNSGTVTGLRVELTNGRYKDLSAEEADDYSGKTVYTLSRGKAEPKAVLTISYRAPE